MVAYFSEKFSLGLHIFILCCLYRLSPALCSGLVVVNMLFAVTSLSPNTPPSSSLGSSSSSDDDDDDDEENKGKKKTKWLVKKKNLSRISRINLMRRAQSLGDLLLTTTNNKKNKKKKKPLSRQTLLRLPRWVPRLPRMTMMMMTKKTKEKRKQNGSLRKKIYPVSVV